MLNIKVNNLNEAVHEAVLQFNLFCLDKEKVTICLTGGNFGEAFTKNLDFLDKSAIKFNILLSDERFIGSSEEESNQRIIKENLIKNLTSSSSNFMFFNTNKDYSYCFDNLRSRLDFENISHPDFLILSLGVDGHLAGHFHNSILDDSKTFCYTNKAPKPPERRVSFSLEWLRGSKKIILAAIGEDKKNELEKFKNGTGLHSDLIYHPNLIILS